MGLIAMPRSSLIAGNGLAFSTNGLRFYEDCERLGPMVDVRLYHLKAIVVTGPDLIETVLVKNARAYHKPRLLKGLRLIFGDGLLTADGDPWKFRRRLLQPIFNTKRNAGYAEVFTQNVARMLDRWSEGIRDVHPDLIDLCITNMTATLFGVEDPKLNRQIAALAAYCHEMSAEMATARFPLYSMSSRLVRMRFGARIRELEHGIVDRVAELRRGKVPVDDVYERLVSSTDHDGCPMSRKGIRDEMFTMFLAGHETAAAAVSWALQLLASHPDRLELLAHEVTKVCGNEPPTLAHLEAMPYLDRVLMETYRLYPPTHRMGRTVVEPTRLGDVSLVPGDELVLPQWAVHRSARWYDEPHAFRPERWTDQLIDRLPRFAFFPFSGGPRICAGQAFVTIEDALVLAAIIQRFSCQLVEPEVEPFEGLTLLPTGGRMVLRLVERGRAGRQPHVRATPLSSRRLLAASE
jgi:cytochrome P450